MRQDRLIRILMACVLATWSPMWCQCMITAAATATDPTTLHVTCEADEADRCASETSCSSPSPAPVICCGDWCGDSTEPADGTCDCECCDRALTAATSNTSPFNAALALFHAMAGAWNITFDEQNLGAPCWSGIQRAGPPESPPPTLLAQRSLLII